MKLMIKAAKQIIDGGAWLCLRCDNAAQIRQAVDEVNSNPNAKYEAEIKRHREKRSLNANAYAWALITEVANLLRSDKDTIYLEMLKRYGQSEIVSILSHIDPKGYFKYYTVFGAGRVNGKEFTHYKIYKGSSEYDTREMAILIDGIISEAKGLGIETATPEEVSRMKEEWGR